MKYRNTENLLIFERNFYVDNTDIQIESIKPIGQKVDFHS